MLNIDCAALSDISARDAFFWGCWSDKPLDLNLENTRSTGINVHRRHNWAVVTHQTRHLDSLLVESSDLSNEPAILFRGYILDPPITSFSSPIQIREYWKKPLFRRHNGVFVTVLLGAPTAGIAIVGDAFGVMPIYLREIGNTTFFASAANLLLVEGDRYDPVGLSFSLGIGYMLGDRTLIEGVTRLSAATIYRRCNDRVERFQWYDFNRLADGTSEVTDAILEENQELFSQAIRRCVQVADRPLLVPVTAGHDSRRIVGELIANDIAFEAVTVQTIDKHGYDTDFQWARLLTHSLGIHHHILPFPNAEQWHSQDIERVRLFDCEARAHTWSVALFNHFRDSSICLFDGLAGDFTGNSIHGWQFKWDYDDFLESREAIVDKISCASIYRIYQEDFLAPLSSIREILGSLFDRLPRSANTAEIFYALWNASRSAAPWAFKQSGDGQLVICPYLDLDFVEMAYRISPRAKRQRSMQRNCLARYASSVSEYGAPNRLPVEANHIVLNARYNANKSCEKLLTAYLDTGGQHIGLSEALRLRHKAIARVSRYMPGGVARSAWWLKPLLEFISWWSDLSPALRNSVH